jgi:hypothetical protein
MIVPLSRPYACRHGLPVVDGVDTRIYSWTYFAACMDCSFCYDTCCQYGATVERRTVGRILARADDLEAYLGVPRGRWFDGYYRPSDDYPEGRYTRTQVVEGSCAFLNRHGRGCLLHRYALERGLDVHDVKPMVCNLFPVLPENGLLCLPDEIRDGTLTCLGSGPTLYRSARSDLEHYFGPELVTELDVLEAAVIGPPPRTLSLPVVPGGPSQGPIAV